MSSGVQATGRASGLPRHLGRYRLGHKIGEGGMGVVHVALDETGRAVAIKVIREHVAADPEARDRLAREVATLRRVHHPLVAEVLDADVDGDLPYLVTEYVPGQPLDRHVGEFGPLAPDALVRLGRGLVGALEAIHRAGIVHRDLKPGNVLLHDGDPVVIDFGIAHVADDVRLTSTGLVMGTPGYLSPEVVAGGAVTASTDWWGWAATLAFAATGRPPFGRGPVDVVLDRVRRGEYDLDGVEPPLREVLEAALSVEPGWRPAAPALLDELASYADALIRREETTQMAMTPAAMTPATTPLQERWAAEDPDPFGTWFAPEDESEDAAARPKRAGTMLLALVAAAGLGAAVPTGLAIAGGLLLVLARTVDATATGLLRRRAAAGRRRSDSFVATVAAPWRLVAAALTSVPTLVLAVLVAGSGAFVVGLAVHGARGGPGGAPALGAAAGLGALTCWWGPGGSGARRGARAIVRALAPGRRSTVALLLLLAILSAAGCWVAWTVGPDWTPLPGPPLAHLPSFRPFG